MNLLNSSKSLSVVATAVGLSAALSLATAFPAVAFMIGFCGTFDDGGTVDGVIDVEKDGSFDSSGFAEITTTEADGANPRMYTGEDFVENIGVEMVTHPTEGVESFRYTFRFGNFSFPANKFEVYLPKDDEGNVAMDLPDVFPQFEMRDNVLRKDPDELSVVPEPLTILGSGVALGFGAMFKKEHSRRQKKTKTKA